MQIYPVVSNSIWSDWLWIIFSAGIVLIVILYNIFFRSYLHKRQLGKAQLGKTQLGQIQFKEAVKDSFFWIVLALLFNAWFASQFGIQHGVEFFTGYIIEKSLSLDNLFVIFMIFQAFKIPPENQHRILFYGILGAIFMRGILILSGSFLVAKFHWALNFFGFILMIGGVRFFISPNISKDTDTPIFLVKKAEKWRISPLFVALIVIEVSDLMFALDSIPAVFAVTRDPFTAFTSNVFAILGLRALYFVAAGMIAQLRFLKPALALILIFVGGKMMLEEVIFISNWVCILVIFCILGGATVLSRNTVQISQ